MSPPSTDFSSQVVEAVYERAADAIDWSAPVPDSFERLHEALSAFYEKYDRQPGFFNDVDHAVGWVLSTYKNLRVWAKTGPETPAAEIPEREPEPVAVQESEDATPATQAMRVLRFYLNDDAPHTGRLSLTQTEIRIIAEVARYSIDDTKIPTEAYQWVGAATGCSATQAKRSYYGAKKTCAVILYVLGALGPTDALNADTALSRAVSDFRANFRGQHDWSVLVFAANYARPDDGFRVSAPDYAQAIQTRPQQAEKLGWQPENTDDPATLLHGVESKVAEFFGRIDPACVLRCIDHTRDEGGAV
jgi:hypothetical protein